MVKPGAVVISMGINHLNGKLVGDVDFDAVKEVRICHHPGSRRRRPHDHCNAYGEHLYRGTEDAMKSCTVNKLAIGGDAPPRLMGVINVSNESFTRARSVP